MIAEAIIKTVSFFAIWEYPLTKKEIYKWVYLPEHAEVPDYEVFCQEIEELIKDQKLQFCEGRVMLSNISASNALSARQKKWWFAKERITLAQKAVKKIRWIPGLQAVFVCNILPVTVHEKSDIDVFIVTKPNTIWFVRFLTTLTLSLFSLRRNSHDVDKHICLSFYASAEALHFFDLQKGREDIYLLYWLSTLIPIYDSGSITTLLVQENAWVKNSLPQFSQNMFPDQFLLGKNKKNTYRKKNGKQNNFFGLLNSFTKRLQLKKMEKNVSSKRNEDSTDVIITDYMLKFHEKDRREQYAQEWRMMREQL